MNVLLDECLNWRLVRDLPGHNVKNGQLLTLAQERFEVFITGDRNLSYQQNLSNDSIAVMVLHAESTRLVHLRPLMPKVSAMLSALQTGQLVTVGPDATS